MRMDICATRDGPESLGKRGWLGTEYLREKTWTERRTQKSADGPLEYSAEY